MAYDRISFLFCQMFFPVVNCTARALLSQRLERAAHWHYVHRVILQLSAPSTSTTRALSCETETCTHSTAIPYDSLSQQPLFFLFSMILTTLSTFYKWDRRVFVLLCLACFTQYKVFNAHSDCSMLECPFCFRLNNTQFYVYTRFGLSIYLPMDIEVALPLDSCEQSHLNLDVQIALRPRCVPRSEIARPYGSRLLIV